MDTQHIIQMFDQYLVERGKRELSLRTANELLRNHTEESLNSIELKALLEKGLIPHAYQTDTSPRQWYIRFSRAAEYEDRRKAYLVSTKVNLPAVPEAVQKTNPVAVYIIIAIIAGTVYLMFSKESPSKEEPVVYQQTVPPPHSQNTTSDRMPLKKYTLQSTLNDNERNGHVIQTNHETSYHVFDFAGRTVTMKAQMNGRLLTFTYPMKQYYVEKGILASTYVIKVNANGVKEIWFSPDVPNLGYDYIDGTRMAYYEISLLE